ncbi:hypothetical protein BCV69DRAFT_280687 [Microstroma glucosiphilum]|uniref:Uncharacterized protein n=1 Tax=Pseudomicrostroma glucosiphilum TaxID=1684307 RepID=A0A316UCW6_9BASI|nr:hypothetical protein BCV69DRAFT_280687 [Pseudomicrostroma glucosiphilum]PWN23070.1 hypothetical protein BCV69DRAFT_280687 [Pseudomicrostroma glucosiphilum]
MAPSDLSSTMASHIEVDEPQDVQRTARSVQGLLMNIWTTSDDMPSTGVDFFKSIDTLPKAFATYETKDQQWKAVEELADPYLTKAWQRATSFQLPPYWTWTERCLDDWLRLVNYPTLNAVFFDGERTGAIASSSNELWPTQGEDSIPQALDPNAGLLPCPAPRMQVTYGLPYSRRADLYRLEEHDPARWHPLSWNALDQLRQHHSSSFEFSPRSSDGKDGLLFPGIIYVAHASEADVCKAGLQAAAAAARALQLMENLVSTAELLSSSPVVAVMVSAGPLWRLFFATSTPFCETETRYDMYRSRKLDLYIDDLGDRLRLFVILGHLERWLREIHSPWIRRHVEALWTSHLGVTLGITEDESSEDESESVQHLDQEASDSEDLYVEEACASEAGSSEAEDWDPDAWAYDPDEVEDWVEEAQYAGKEAPEPPPW